MAQASANAAFSAMATATVAIPLVKLLPPIPLVQIPPMFLSESVRLKRDVDLSFDTGIPTFIGFPLTSLMAISPPL